MAEVRAIDDSTESGSTPLLVADNPGSPWLRHVLELKRASLASWASRASPLIPLPPVGRVIGSLVIRHFPPEPWPIHSRNLERRLRLGFVQPWPALGLEARHSSGCSAPATYLPEPAQSAPSTGQAAPVSLLQWCADSRPDRQTPARSESTSSGRTCRDWSAIAPPAGVLRVQSLPWEKAYQEMRASIHARIDGFRDG